MKLCFVTSNKGKVDEATAILEFPIEIVSLDLEEIQSLDLEKIITHKLVQAYEKIKQPVIVDDVSVHVNAWKGFPGPFIKYLREAGGNELMLHMLKHEKDRSVLLTAMIGFHDGKNIYTFRGEIPATIAPESRGARGWGFDPILIPDSYTQTYAEMSETEKNANSHRRRALEKFKEFLKEKNYSFD